MNPVYDLTNKEKMDKPKFSDEDIQAIKEYLELLIEIDNKHNKDTKIEEK